MTIIGQDNRTEVTNFNEDPFDSVVAVDSVNNGDIDIGQGVDAAEGSGILISPYHVLTAAHVIDNMQAARITLAQNVPNLPTRTLTQFLLKDANASKSNEGALDKDRRYNGNVEDGYDIGLITLSKDESFTDSSKYVGLLAFEDPEDALGYTVTTAGYPGLVRNADLDISNNAQYVLRKDNGDPLLPSQDLFGSVGTAAQILFTATGTIDEVQSNGNLKLSDSIDIEKGQSGSGLWATLEGDEPRVLGVMSRQKLGLSPIGIPIGLNNFAASIDTITYGRLVERMKNRLKVESGNNLPENAIIGSGENDTIKGSYLRERILGNEGQDTISAGEADDRLEGGSGYDVLKGEKGNDRLQGDGASDFLDGGEGENDIAVFSDEYTTENYKYEKITGSTFGSVDELITFEHIGGTYADGKDTLEGIEWAEFKGEQIDLGNLRLAASASTPAPRIIPLPLEDGIIETETVRAIDNTASPSPNDPPTPPYISLSMPVEMLDGNVDYTLNISPYKPNIEYNIAYIFDTSASMDAGELQAAKDAYTDLTNYFINNGLAENINFGVVKFSRNATLYQNLTAQQAISTIQGLTSSPAIEGTKYNDALYQGMNFITQSPLKGTTNIAYFVSDGRSQTNFADPGDVSYVYDAMNLRRVSNVQSFGIYDPQDPAGVTESQINFVDSNNGVLVNSASQLSPELIKSGLADKVAQVNILVDGEVVDTIQPSQLTDSPLGLTYEGSVENLDVSVDAQNVITAEVVFNDSTITTSAEFTVTAGDGKLLDASGNPIVEVANENDEDPLERIRDGSEGDDDITLGYPDRGANGGAGGDYIVGNNRDNILDGGDGNDTIKGYGENDTIITGTGSNKVDGGEGIDTVLYGDVIYQGNNIPLRQAANTVLYNNTDTLTDIEFIQFSDVRISAETLQVVPILDVAEISVTEGDSGNTTAQFTLNLSTPAPVDVVFNYSTVDIDAVAGSDYVASSGQITIPTGQTSATVSVTINGDTTFEPNEGFGLTLSGLSGATFKDNKTEYSVVATIANDEPFNYTPVSLGIPDTVVTTGAPNQSIKLDDVFADIEDTTFTYSIQNNTNSGLFDAVTIDQAQKILLLDYQANATGISSLTIRATDSQGLFVDATFTVSAIAATGNNDTIAGGDGNDYLNGNLGNDSISGLSGDDTLTGAAGVDTLIGGAGDDTYLVDTATDTITENPNEGIDTVSSSITYTLGATSNLENITLTGTTAINATGNATSNELKGSSGNNNLAGGIGDDTLDGGIGIDTLIGSTGNDVYVVNTTTDTITENQGEGTDTVTSSVTYTLGATSNLENITLTGTTAINATGNTGNNQLEGNSGNNNLSGGSGDDTLTGGDGVDTLIGGVGNDAYIVDTTTDTITENANQGTDTVASSVTYTIGANIENLTLIGSTAINGIGNTLNNTLTGNAANNILNAGTGSDTMTGNTGNDTYLVDNIADVISETSTTATEIDTVRSSITYTLDANLENLVLTGTTVINGTGNSLNNSITGNGVNNSLTGADGDDTLSGAVGSDTMTGDTGNDTYVVDNIGDVVSETLTTATEIDSVQTSITYTLGSNLENLTLTGAGAISGTGNTLDNSLTGNAANNKLTGGIGNDSLTGNAGIDTLIGGAGNDNYVVDTTTDTITENTNEGTDSIDSSVTYTLVSNLENLTLTGTDAINGTGNILDNTLTGNTANNSLSGDAGNDSLTGGAGIDTLIGGAGNDNYVIDTTTDILTENTNEGTDSVDSNVTYTLASQIENLTLTGTNTIKGTGNTINNTITGNTANNTLTGDAGVDTLIGGAGNDTYMVDTTTDTLTENANEGIDSVASSVTYTLVNNIENLTLTGAGFINGIGNLLDNTMTGNSGNNSLSGDAGNDSLTGGAGVDTLIGGTGNDTYVVAVTTDSIAENTSEGTDSVNSSVTYTLVNNIENLTLTGTSAVNGTGNTIDNTMIGNNSSNILSGDAGNDSLTGGGRIDTLIGGVGNDTYIVDTTTDTLTENANEGTDSVNSSVTYTLASQIENLTLTGTSAINGTGNTLNNVLTGNTANNTLSGDAGIDTLIGGTGDDTYVIDTTTDILTENTNEGTDSVNSNVTYTLVNNIENLTLTSTSAINGTGNTLNNIITGNNANNILTGGAGIDTLIGGAGNDIYVVDTTTDTLTENANEGIDRVNSSVTYTLGDNLENLTLTGTSVINGTGNTINNTITGNTVSNALWGGLGNDTLIGGAGNDLFTGSSGNDSLTGGADSDRFIYNTNAVFTTSTVGIDILTDFTNGTDKIVLDKTTFTALTSIAGNGFNIGSDFAVVGSDAAAATNSALIVYSSGTGNLFYNQNGVTTGLGSGEQFATLSAMPALSANDFILQA